MTGRMISPAEAHALLAADDAILIDVREPDEFAAAHIAQAWSVPLGRVAAMLAGDGVPAGRTIIFQCQKGARGGQACDLAPEAPGRQVRNLSGGIEGWAAAGYPVMRAAATGVSIFRQVQMVIGTLVALGVVAGLAGWTPGYVVAGLFGAALATAGVTGWCGLALLLKRMPWNRAAG